ncbi:MAG: putative toxin-antitoxin system toxin component, PIN family [Syntrophorhabdus sp.]|nr:putative toxin-antitoxin system toxin component, PIN family [Syntrophorhabdus sp.]
MMRRIVVDTNVMASALLFGGNPREVLLQAIRGEIGLGMSPAMLYELQGVLSRKKFGLAEQLVETVMNEVTGLSDMVFPRRSVSVIERDPDDNMVLECALEYRAQAIISGDEHLLALAAFENIPILTPAQYLETK